MLQSVKVDDKIDAAHNRSEDESDSNAFRKEGNFFLELQDEDGWKSEDQDDEKSRVNI